MDDKRKIINLLSKLTIEGMPKHDGTDNIVYDQDGKVFALFSKPPYVEGSRVHVYNEARNLSKVVEVIGVEGNHTSYVVEIE